MYQLDSITTSGYIEGVDVLEGVIIQESPSHFARSVVADHYGPRVFSTKDPEQTQ